MVIIAVIKESCQIEKILKSLDISTEPPTFHRARAPPALFE
jgi:hypothetical protein